MAHSMPQSGAVHHIKSRRCGAPLGVRFASNSGLSGQIQMASRSVPRNFLSRLICHSRLMASLRVLQHSE
jgi:hypothetical protein